MDNVKIVFFDMDGTLVDPATRLISDKTFETLRALHRRGYLVCIATGRPTASLPDFGDLHIDAFITFNGSLCYAGDKILHSSPFSREDVKQVLENAATLGRPVSVATRSRLAANGIDKDLSDYYGVVNRVLTVAEDFDHAVQEDIYQIMLGAYPEEYDVIVRNTKAVKLALSWERAVDVIPSYSGKGASISKILDHFALDASQAMAFGDSYNDIEMLQYVGKGIAMGNAPEAVKEIADDVCGHVSKEGIYFYCLEHGMLG